MKRFALCCLLNDYDPVACCFQPMHQPGRILFILPIDRVGSAQCCFMDLPVWWGAGNSSEVDFCHTEGIRGAKDRAYIVQAPYVVQHDGNRELFRSLEFTHRKPAELVETEFFHRKPL